jgi:DNA polymerase delta subunit 2
MTVTVTVASPSADNRPKRAFCSHQPKWQRFQPTHLKLETKKAGEKEKETYQYQRQYSHVYSQRLTALRSRCWSQFETVSTTGTYTRFNRVLELREDVPSRIVGTLVKEPSDKDEAPIHPETECRPSDQLFLEDESGRVALQLDHVHDYCTGLVVGVQGKVDKVGTFHVEELVFPAPPAQPNLEGSSTMLPATLDANGDSSATKAPHVLLVSSLLCGDPNVPSLPRDMLAAYLQGQFTKDAAKVCRVLVVGGGPSSSATQDALHGVKEFDAFCLQLTKAGIPIDVIPGKNDPTTANWPQRPLHSSLMPHATAIVHRTPNPYAAALGSQLVLATDGTNIKDLQRQALSRNNGEDGTTTTVPSSELDALKRTLQWSHICPTGPDSVPTVPHMDQDPMVLEQLPHLYVCGNTTKFATTTTDDKKTTLLCVPQFSTTGEAVLVNLETMGVELLRFEDEESSS